MPGISLCGGGDPLTGSPCAGNAFGGGVAPRGWTGPEAAAAGAAAAVAPVIHFKFHRSASELWAPAAQPSGLPGGGDGCGCVGPACGGGRGCVVPATSRGGSDSSVAGGSACFASGGVAVAAPTWGSAGGGGGGLCSHGCPIGTGGGLDGGASCGCDTSTSAGGSSGDAPVRIMTTGTSAVKDSPSLPRHVNVIIGNLGAAFAAMMVVRPRLAGWRAASAR